MRRPIFAALALIAIPSLDAAAAAVPIADQSYATPVAGNWTWSPIAGGSQASFVDRSVRPQLIVQCTRATRRVTISKPASAAAPSLDIWTSISTRSIPATFNPATSRLSADLAPFDPLLDAIAFSRGRFAVSVLGQPPMVLPSWADVARVIEDCRV